MRQSREANMITAAAMEREFQLNPLGRTWEHSRTGQETLRRLSRRILAAVEPEDSGLDTPGTSA